MWGLESRSRSRTSRSWPRILWKSFGLGLEVWDRSRSRLGGYGLDYITGTLSHVTHLENNGRSPAILQKFLFNVVVYVYHVSVKLFWCPSILLNLLPLQLLTQSLCTWACFSSFLSCYCFVYLICLSLIQCHLLLYFRLLRMKRLHFTFDLCQQQGWLCIWSICFFTNPLWLEHAKTQAQVYVISLFSSTWN